MQCVGERRGNAHVVGVVAHDPGPVDPRVYREAQLTIGRDRRRDVARKARADEAQGFKFALQPVARIVFATRVRLERVRVSTRLDAVNAVVPAAVDDRQPADRRSTHARSGRADALIRR
jgi:hypothetical protein